MRVVQRICFVALMSSMLAAQSTTPSASDATQMKNDVQKLLEAVQAQQKSMAEQQKQITEQQIEIERLKQQLSAQPQAASANSEAQTARVVNATLTAPSTNPVARPISDTAMQEQPKDSPLSFRIGGADFTPGGFMDFTTIFRSTNTGALGTNFFSIPFSPAANAHLTETRFTATNSRISLKATSKFLGNDVTGYVEMDFLGNDANNVNVTSNGHTFRQRQYWVDVKRGKWEVLAGQAWSWLTPNRVGLSSNPSEVNNTYDMDFNYQVGLTWTRAPQFRLVYHPNDHWGMGLALENPQQFFGPSGITLPSNGTGIAAPVAAFFDVNSGGSPAVGGANGTPNVFPDFIPKIAYDTDMGGKHFHAEAAGLLTSAKIDNIPVGGPTFVTHTKIGGGVQSAVNLEVIKNFRIVASGFYGEGGGRYMFGSGPQAVVLPTITGTDLRISMVHSGSGILGFETQVTPKTLFFGYYGGDYFQRNFSTDFTVAPNAAGLRPNVGFGFGPVFNGAVQVFPGSGTASNRDIQEGTLGWIQTFWRNPQYGALQLITQASYLTRSPWFVAAGAPKNAHLGMGWANLRYVLP
jgi:hypothetical protein